MNIHFNIHNFFFNFILSKFIHFLYFYILNKDHFWSLSWSKDETKIAYIVEEKKKEDREKVKDDYRMPFAKRYEDITLPCRIDKKDEFTGCNL